MEGSDRVARYFRQLQEMGESDIVLSSATAADALRSLRGAMSLKEPTARDSAAEVEKPAIRDADTGDWRATLRAAGVAEEIPRTNKPAAAAPSNTAPPEAVIPRYALPEPDQQERRNAASEVTLPSGIEIHPQASDIFSSAGAFDSLEHLAQAVATCKRCALHQAALNPVPGEGNPSADLVCVGEGPGASEDETGRPFVGAAGKLLTSILGAIKLRREDVFICNVVKHRPPGNRTPLPDEITACQPYLSRQLELIRPKAILALGTVAAQTLLGTKLTIGKLRGSIHRYHGTPLIVTYHPAALLRNPSWKRPTWEDVQHVRRILDGAG